MVAGRGISRLQLGERVEMNVLQSPPNYETCSSHGDL